MTQSIKSLEWKLTSLTPLASDQDTFPFYTATNVASILGISSSSAYRVIRSLNKELQSKGYIVIRGKVSKKYFDEKFYQ